MAGAGDTERKLCEEEATAREGVAKQEEWIRDIITELCHQQSSNFASLREDIHKEITSRDILLQKLEESVTRLSEDIASLKDYVTAKMQEEAHSAMPQSSGSSESGATQDGDQGNEVERNIRAQNRCVDVMMSLTEIRKINEEKTQKVRGFYEKIYKASPFTAHMLTFLERNRGVKVIVDCDSSDISNLVKQLANLDGEKCAGRACITFTEFCEGKVYLGGNAGLYFIQEAGIRFPRNRFEPEVSLAQSLAQMVMYLIFKNRGCPYVFDDYLHEKVYENIVEEASKKKTAGALMGNLIDNALSMKTPLGREVSLISAVPAMLVKYGLQEGMSKLQEQMPSLTFFFIHHVIPKECYKPPTNIYKK